MARLTSTLGEPGRDVSSCAARVIPTTTGFTNSRWLGLGDRRTRTFLPATSRSSCHPMWYFTSPLGSSLFCAAASLPLSCAALNPASIISTGLLSTWVSTFSRPRCAMPMMTSSAPAAAASAMISSSMGTMASVPSMENRFCPLNARWRKFSKPCTWDSRSSRARRRSADRGCRYSPPSMASRSQARSSGSGRCRNSYPTLPMYAARSRCTSASALADDGSWPKTADAGRAARSASLSP